jgi:hypothetical protein
VVKKLTLLKLRGGAPQGIFRPTCMKNPLLPGILALAIAGCGFSEPNAQ